MALWQPLGTLEDNEPAPAPAGLEPLLSALASIAPEWLADAACREHDPAFWFTPNNTPAATLAKAICSTCLVRADCDTYAQADPHLDGIWAGHTHKERTGQ